MISEAHGSIVAAPTFGLPERIAAARATGTIATHGIRDASFTLYALMRLGYRDEARAFLHWMEARCRELRPGCPLQIMYRLDGSHELPEKQLAPLRRLYEVVLPMRIGNAASNQLQLDVYGEMMDAVYIFDRHE